ncbi:MAG: hypothetical protein KGY50_00550 [Candidatus Thermoplasmatota archaeon]|nr:hypothetical protein [Candidatus Thermoplasmatota archaeon]
MFSEQECETKVHCPECNKPMYTLKDALSPIFICSHCGASVDKKTLDERGYQINEMSNGSFNGEQSLLRNLFSKQFMKKYTDFTSFSDFIKACEFFNDSLENLSKENIQKIPERKINRYVKQHTCFPTWDQMFEKAVEWYLKM